MTDNPYAPPPEDTQAQRRSFVWLLLSLFGMLMLGLVIGGAFAYQFGYNLGYLQAELDAPWVGLPDE